MALNLVVDRNVSRFLSTTDFLAFRKTCHTTYDDEEAWYQRANQLPIHIATLNHKKLIGLHYLLSWSLRFNLIPGSIDWYKQTIQWLSYKVSIRILFAFLTTQSIDSLMYALDNIELDSKQRFHWQRLLHRFNYTRVFKRRRLDLDVFERRPIKKSCFSHSRYLQSCVA